MFYFFRILQFFCIVKHNDLHNTLHLQRYSRRYTHVNLSEKIQLFGHKIRTSKLFYRIEVLIFAFINFHFQFEQCPLPIPFSHPKTPA